MYRAALIGPLGLTARLDAVSHGLSSSAHNAGVADWFVINVAEATAYQYEGAGSYVPFEDREDRFPDLGINIHVLPPGEPNGKYHSESVQEDFLVLSGECLAIIEGEEHRLRAWDFVHCPAGTEHVFVGAGEQPCAILMVGARRAGATLRYPANDLAARYGASAPQTTSDPEEAYTDWPTDFETTRLDWPPRRRDFACRRPSGVARPAQIRQGAG